MAAYYNEHDKFCAQWLRNLIAAGLIAPGDVDDRDIRDVPACDLRGYTQVHLFAGIGCWSHALRMAGFGDDRTIWTASCPCQPFSAAGCGDGIFDDRHLWPAVHWLVGQHAPCTILGEQVASPDGLAWLDIVSADLGACGYACGALDFPSAGVAAPNIRQRLWWGAERLADASGGEQQRLRQRSARDGWRELPPGGHRAAGGLAVTDGDRREPGREAAAAVGHRGAAVADGNARGLGGTEGVGPPAGARKPDARHGAHQPQRSGDAGRLGDTGNAGLPHAEPPDLRGAGRGREGGTAQQSGGASDPWRDLEWLYCRDGTWRPAQSEFQSVVDGHTGGLGRVRTHPLAARQPGDVQKLRAYGNAINPVAAAAVIRAWMSRDQT